MPEMLVVKILLSQAPSLLYWTRGLALVSMLKAAWLGLGLGLGLGGWGQG